MSETVERWEKGPGYLISTRPVALLRINGKAALRGPEALIDRIISDHAAAVRERALREAASHVVNRTVGEHDEFPKDYINILLPLSRWQALCRAVTDSAAALLTPASEGEGQ